MHVGILTLAFSSNHRCAVRPLRDSSIAVGSYWTRCKHQIVSGFPSEDGLTCSMCRFCCFAHMLQNFLPLDPLLVLWHPSVVEHFLGSICQSLLARCMLERGVSHECTILAGYGERKWCLIIPIGGARLVHIHQKKVFGVYFRATLWLCVAVFSPPPIDFTLWWHRF